ncbi:MAG TPA: pectinesterase family protein [Pyrinomonadaceae bacterium]|jgi:pectin methylesterase-like acyl-CoA thioesterase
MKNLKKSLLFVAALALVALALPFVAGAAGTSLVNDVYADGNSNVQDLANNSIRLFKGRAATVRNDAVGAVTLDMTATGSNSEAFWGYFTNSGAPVNLGVGEKLTVSGTFSLTGFVGGGQDVRFGVLNSQSSRNANDLTGGMNDASFANDTGYALGFFASGSGSPFTVYRRKDAAQLTGANNPFNTFADFIAIPGAGATTRQTLANATPYTLTYTIERLTAADTKISVAVTGGALSNLAYTATETSQAPLTAFDYFGFRVGGNTFAQKITFTNWKVEYIPALPVITSQPQPSNLVVQVGSNVTMAVAASGNALTYQWRKNGATIAGNASATTPTLNLTNVQTGDAGSYTCVVTNAGGSVTSNPVALGVSVDPVPPPPSIVAQPANTNAPLGSPATLSVVATGENLFYQWFKNGALINGATQATLGFASAQTADSASYTVVVSNSSGSVTSDAAKLLVVSTMTATGVAPAPGATEINTDAPLAVTFNQTPKVGTTGRLRIYQEDGTVVDTIDMSAAAQTRVNGTVTFNYYPVIVSGNVANIYPHQKLAYGQNYYVTMEPGVVTDATGAPFAGISDPFTWRFSTKAAGPAAGTTALTVAANGAGDFSTVQGAIDFVPANNTKRVVITVKPGTYTEIVYVQSNKPFVTVRGEDRNASVVQYANNNTFNPTSTTTRAMFGVDAADFTLENITLRNTTPQGGSQAEALRGNNNRIVLNKVNLYSYQDTLLLQGQSNQGGFVTDSYIEGDVDFVWGAGAVFFQNTELKMLRTDAFYNQARNAVGRNGYVYVNCKFTRANGITGAYLNRIDPDDFPYSQIVLINSQLDGVRPDPWQFNSPSFAVNATNYPNIRMWEYNSRDLNGNALDVSQRAAVSRQLTAAEAAQWSDPSFVLGGWTPSTKLTAAVNLDNLSQNYTGSPLAPTVTTYPAGLPVTVTYNGSTTPPNAIGSYAVVATINDATYQGTAAGTFVINRVPAAITFGNLYQTADGTPKAVTVNTVPAGVPVTVTYNGSATPPAAAGTYTVLAAVNDPGYSGSASATLTLYAPGTQPLRAFPGAEGAGATTAGGRGGDVYHVTNLNDSGAGSLREGIRTATGPRTIVFDLSGTIYLTSRLNINKPNLTIAGQTAPGDGITVAGWNTIVSNTHDVIVRYLRFRVGDINCPSYQDDGFGVDKATNVIVDHVSASWSVDETLSVTESDKVTVQWSFITESMRNSCHEKGTHGYGSLVRYGNGQVTYHHNLYAHHDSRNPRVGDSIGFDFVNNVVYDWGIKSGYSGDATEGTTRINFVGNYLVAGPSTPASSRARGFEGGSLNTQIYQSNNLIDGNLNGQRDGANTDWAMIVGTFTQRTPARFEFAQVETDDAKTAYDRVLHVAGNSRARDAVDTRIVTEVQGETGHFINSPTEVGGWPALNSTNAPADTDGDGIPDQWESVHGLNPADAADGRAVTAGGYSNLENYLNDIVGVPGTDNANDHTAPTTAATLSQGANEAGWHNSDVTLNLAATDNDGGVGVHEIIYSVNGTVMHAHDNSTTLTIAAEGVNTVTFYAKDNAGNAEPAQTVVVKLDKTAPTVGEVTRTPANAQGWNNTDVVANYTATDALSGFAEGTTAAGTFTISSEGAAQSYTFDVTDLAGNTAHGTLSNVNIDKTAPAVSAGRDTPANAAGWNNTDVNASYTASDALSGLDAGSPAAGTYTFNAEGAGQSYTFTAQDVAGNTASATVGDVNIDKTAPVVNAVRDTAPNAAGWNNTDVAASYTASDALSGLASPASGGYTFTAEGANQSYTFTVQDAAGNTASGVVNGVNIDKTAPVISVAQPGEGGFYQLNQAAQASYNCTDALSGTNCVGTVASGSAFDTATVGGKVFGVSATDLAGNTAGASVNYTVGYKLGLLYDPNKVNKAGSTVPVKLQLGDAAGANLSAAGTVVRAVGVGLVSTETYGAPTDAGNANPDLNFRFDPALGGPGGYIFNLKTTGLAAGTYNLYFTVGADPYVYTTPFQLR